MADKTVADALALFHKMIERSADNALRQTRAAGSTALEEQEREYTWHTLSYALQVPEAWPSARELLLASAPRVEQAGYRHEWISYLKKGIQLCHKYGDRAAEADLHVHVGILHQLTSEFQPAREHFQASLAIFSELDDTYGQARVLNRLGKTAEQQGRYDEAEEHVLQAMQLVDDKIEHAYSRLILGSVECYRRDWEKAIVFLRQSLNTWEEVDDKRMLAWTHTNLGYAYRRKGQIDTARYHLRQAITYFEEIKDPVHKARALGNLGNTYLKEDQPEIALGYYLQAEQIFRSSSGKSSLAVAHLNLGTAYRDMDLLDKAERAYLECAAGWEELGRWALSANALHETGNLYMLQKRYGEAVDFQERALALLGKEKDAPEYQIYKKAMSEQLATAKQMFEMVDNEP